MELTFCDVSSLIGVSSGVIAMIFYNIRKSRCTYIECPCCKIKRNVDNREISELPI